MADRARNDVSSSFNTSRADNISFPQHRGSCPPERKEPDIRRTRSSDVMKALKLKVLAADELIRKYKQLKQRHEKLYRLYKYEEKQLSDVEQTNREQQKTIEALNSDIVREKAGNQGLENLIDQFSARLEEAEKQREEATSKLHEVEEERNELKKQVSDKNKRIEKLERRIESLKVTSKARRKSRKSSVADSGFFDITPLTPPLESPDMQHVAAVREEEMMTACTEEDLSASEFEDVPLSHTSDPLNSDTVSSVSSAPSMPMFSKSFGQPLSKVSTPDLLEPLQLSKASTLSGDHKIAPEPSSSGVQSTPSSAEVPSVAEPHGGPATHSRSKRKPVRSQGKARGQYQQVAPGEPPQKDTSSPAALNCIMFEESQQSLKRQQHSTPTNDSEMSGLLCSLLSEPSGVNVLGDIEQSPFPEESTLFESYQPLFTTGVTNDIESLSDSELDSDAPCGLQTILEKSSDLESSPKKVCDLGTGPQASALETPVRSFDLETISVDLRGGYGSESSTEDCVHGIESTDVLMEELEVGADTSEGLASKETQVSSQDRVMADYSAMDHIPHQSSLLDTSTLSGDDVMQEIAAILSHPILTLRAPLTPIPSPPVPMTPANVPTAAEREGAQQLSCEGSSEAFAVLQGSSNRVRKTRSHTRHSKRCLMGPPYSVTIPTRSRRCKGVVIGSGSSIQPADIHCEQSILSSESPESVHECTAKYVSPPSPHFSSDERIGQPVDDSDSEAMTTSKALLPPSTIAGTGPPRDSQGYTEIDSDESGNCQGGDSDLSFVCVLSSGTGSNHTLGEPISDQSPPELTSGINDITSVATVNGNTAVPDCRANGDETRPETASGVTDTLLTLPTDATVLPDEVGGLNRMPKAGFTLRSDKVSPVSSILRCDLDREVTPDEQVALHQTDGLDRALTTFDPDVSSHPTSQNTPYQTRSIARQNAPENTPQNTPHQTRSIACQSTPENTPRNTVGNSSLTEESTRSKSLADPQSLLRESESVVLEDGEIDDDDEDGLTETIQTSSVVEPSPVAVHAPAGKKRSPPSGQLHTQTPPQKQQKSFLPPPQEPQLASVLWLDPLVDSGCCKKGTKKRNCPKRGKSYKEFRYVTASLVRLHKKECGVMSVLKMFGQSDNVRFSNSFVKGLKAFLVDYKPMWSELQELLKSRLDVVSSKSVGRWKDSPPLAPEEDPKSPCFIPCLLPFEASLMWLMVQLSQNNQFVQPSSLDSQLVVDVKEMLYGLIKETTSQFHLCCALVRLYVCCCRLLKGTLEHVQLLCCELMSQQGAIEKKNHVLPLLQSVASVWPLALTRSHDCSQLQKNKYYSPVLLEKDLLTHLPEVIVAHILWRDNPDGFKNMVYKSLYLLCGWRQLSKDTLQQASLGLIKVLQTSPNVSVVRHQPQGGPPQLNPLAERILSLLSLSCQVLGWQWTSDVLIRRELWPILQAWNKKDLLQPVKEVTIVCICKLIGMISHLGVGFECVSTKRVHPIQQLTNLLVSLVKKSKDNKDVTIPIQLAAVHSLLTLCSLDSSTGVTAQDVLSSWIQQKKASKEVPEELLCQYAVSVGKLHSEDLVQFKESTY